MQLLSQFLETAAKHYGHGDAKKGAPLLQGAIVFLALKRPLDQLIQASLGLSHYHFGSPSPWSHTILLAEPFKGPETAILECTIRDKNDQVEWDMPSIPDIITIVSNGAGGIYEAALCSYDDKRVRPFGVKVLPGLVQGDRDRIVARARDLMTQNIHYDFQGLFRELVQMVLGIDIKPSGNNMFCSAFCQEVYRKAFPDGEGDFAPEKLSQDVSPDDLWFNKTEGNYSPSSLLATSAPALTMEQIAHKMAARRHKKGR